MKFSSLTLIALTTTTILTISPNPVDGCLYRFSDGNCAQCFHRNILLDGSGCGPKLSNSDKCSLYQKGEVKGKSQSYCSHCKPGYARRYNTKPDGTITGKSISSCLPSKIKNCVDEYVVGEGHGCLGCSGGLYVDYTADGTYFCKEVSKPIPHCMWGSYAFGSNKPSCFRCEEGYAITYGTKGHKNLCVKANKPGCLVNQKGSSGCSICDPYSGYSMDARDNCVKNDSESAQMAFSNVLGALIRI